MSLRSFTRRAAGALVLGLAACRPDATEPQTPALSRAEADSLAEALTAEVVALSEGAVYIGAIGMPFPVAPASSPETRFVTCTPTRTPNPPINSDSDPIPDLVLLDFAGCIISTPTHTITLSGTIELSDLNPTVTDHSVKSVFTDFGRSVTDLISGRTTSMVQNGTREFEASATELRHSETAFRTEFTAADGSKSSHVKDWSSTFTPDEGLSISPRSPLPSGTWDIHGTSTWTRGDRSASLAVTTDPPLHYNASCERAPRFDAGKLTAVVTRGGQTSTVTILYTACGEYTVTRS